MKVAKYVFASVLISYVVLSYSSFADRPTIAVRDFKSVTKSIVIGEEYFSFKWGAEQTNLLTSDFITTLVNTRKFDVLERERMNAIIEELKLGETEYVSPEQAIKMGQLAQADYFVMGQIELIEANQNKYQIPYSNHWQTEARGRMVVNMRIVDVRSGKIVTAKKVNVIEVQKSSSRDPITPLSFMERLKEKTVNILVNEVVEGVFPTKIINVVGNQVFLNRGRGAFFRVGDIMKVYNLGEELIDPDTQESLGSTEIEVGRIKITEIQPKFSKAQIVEGQVELISKGAICRLIQWVPEPVPGKPLTPGSSSKPPPW
ncbi:MAG: CsgG/HfaB family protein [Candidatus Brocadiales bacterium]